MPYDLDAATSYTAEYIRRVIADAVREQNERDERRAAILAATA